MIRKLLAPWLGLVLLIGCSTPISDQFMGDAQLLVTMTKSVASAVASDPSVPPAVINDINGALGTLQTALNDLKSGLKTPTDFATLASDVLNGVKGPILTALGANSEIMVGINIGIALLPVLAADLEAKSSMPTMQASGVRTKAMAYVARHH